MKKKGGRRRAKTAAKGTEGNAQREEPLISDWADMRRLSSQEDTVQTQAPTDDTMEDHSLVGCSDSELGAWDGC